MPRLQGMATLAELAAEEAERLPGEVEAARREWADRHRQTVDQYQALAQADDAEHRRAAGLLRVEVLRSEQAEPYLDSSRPGVSILYLRDVIVDTARREGRTVEATHEYDDGSYVYVRATKTGRVTVEARSAP